MARALCAMHRDRPAAVRCSRCHKPACSDCAITMAHGNFCSMECSVAYQDFQRQKRIAVKMAPTPLMGIMIVFFSIALLAIGWHWVASKSGNPKLQQFDFIGRLLNVYKERPWEKPGR